VFRNYLIFYQVQADTVQSSTSCTPPRIMYPCCSPRV